MARPELVHSHRIARETLQGVGEQRLVSEHTEGIRALLLVRGLVHMVSTAGPLWGMFWSASKQGWWAYTQKKSGCHCQQATWGIPVSTLGGLKQGSGQICDITNGLPILGHISGRAPVDGPPTHTTDRPQSRSKEKKNVAHGPGREALIFGQCSSSNLC